MNSKVKRLENVIKRLEYILRSDDLELLLSDKDLRLIEFILGVKPHSTKDKEVKRISGRGFKKKSHK